MVLFTGRHFWNRKCRKKTWWQQEFAVFKCEATANSVTGHVCVNSNGEEVQVMFRDVKNYDIMSASEPESCLQIYGERRMAITIAASAAVSIEDANRDIMSAEEKNAAAKQTYSFLAPLRNEQPCEAGR